MILFSFLSWSLKYIIIRINLRLTGITIRLCRLRDKGMCVCVCVCVYVCVRVRACVVWFGLVWCGVVWCGVVCVCVCVIALNY